MLDLMTGGLPPQIFAAALVLCFVAAFVKGAIGFGMPLILIATLPTLMPLPQALAAAILPFLVSNLHQALRDGPRAMARTLGQFWRFGVAMVVMIFVSAPFVVLFASNTLFILLGVTILGFAAMQLRPRTTASRLSLRQKTALEWGLGGTAGFFGGFSGVWGPPTVAFMLAVGVEKRVMGRAQCALYTLGAVMLLLAHLRTGVLNAQTAPLSAVLLVPVLLGTLAGFRAQDRMDPARFRFWVTVMLIVSALNLIRRGLMG